MRASLIVIAVAFLFLGGLFLVLGGRSLLDAWRYGQALHADGTATSTALRPATATSSTEYEISYHATIEGQRYDRTDIVPVHIWERAEHGAPVPVEYLPGRPDTIRVAVDDPRAARQSLIFTAIGALLFLGGLFAAVRAVRWRPPEADAPSTAPPIAVPAFEASFWPRARQSADFWLGTIFLIVSTPFVIMTLVQSAEELRFVRSGVSTDGMILTKEIKAARRNRTSYEATYRVMVPEGAFESRARIPFDAWSKLRERESVEVVYLADRPTKSRLKASREWQGLAILALVSVVFFPVGATFFRRSIRRARLEWRLRHTGAAATGVIAEIADRNLKINDVRQFRLTYEYDDFQARRYTGTHDVPEDEALLWKVGDTGAVRYDSQQPAESIWLGRQS